MMLQHHDGTGSRKKKSCGGQMTHFKKKKIQVLVRQVGWIKDNLVKNWHELQPVDEKELQVRP